MRQWWSEPVDYVAQVQYFARRTMSTAIQVMIGLGTGLNAIISLAVLLPSAVSTAAQVAVVTFALFQVGWAWAWCRRPWPSRRMSLAFVISADIGIAAVALLDPTWLFGLFGFNAFAMISVYLMFFDGPKALAGHVLCIMVTTMLFVTEIVDAGTEFASVVVTTSTVAAVVPAIATPLGIQFGIWALRNDANESVTDPLTGLLNRRGLHLHIGELLRAATLHEKVAVMVVDLDRFKEVNDTFGHTTGDEVLIRSSRRIKSAVRGSALVARVGGEEFVVVDLVAPDHVDGESDRVRHAIAAPADPAITASVGVTTVALADFAPRGVDAVALLDVIIERADHAMFDAKRNGGNATIQLPSTWFG